MNVQILAVDPIRVAMIRHSGPYEGIGAVFEQLWNWVNTHGVPAVRSIGIYWDNPDYVAASRLRSAACVEVPPYFALSDRGGLPISDEIIVGGNYAYTRYVGPYESLAPVWTEFTRRIEHDLGRKITNDPAFEVYVNDPSNTPPSELITELYMPVR